MIDWLTNNAGMSGLLFFFIVFLCIAGWSYRPGAKENMESHKYIPLEGDEQ
ncbi:cbb3-type cytochrome c oxidase subunit 3 [Kordiimonas aquimaris]|uniref:cbb3-type cytochrome c oxidase subunit 3 n=1 Tax=Kordiimonas aquimaris TaxID=707591 RepID=UPI0021D264D9|nr:cbb3-type cytochrome c oxidase subunit 3 [Kordiimonas aquimaris]